MNVGSNRRKRSGACPTVRLETRDEKKRIMYRANHTVIRTVKRKVIRNAI
jgi:hypothetical protein